ncbi:gamma-glutamyl-gamma-aminobutyrate hydrolase family protein [Streptomyces sp. NBC_01363]|uniref:gamma-glutamyl-gamma-aminobutyrate hydrolase family protein n=1 Tax=Streptomyces sp. NBC_01363 TaxID=2903840 RepID=UPI00225928A1|nr:gamma-glutamyl-gamma-aminobutyrate hydrolase family protein [Streptomyces sp. NBC_01363]MCX4736955.1 gamma-glutamyl-gamma-aminobutyrate hydrolase family protein [Streptomyces sp. NBC_01363]
MSSWNSPERARRPLIGITGRRVSAEGRLDIEPRYRSREFDMHYSDFAMRLAERGAVPVQLPYEAIGPDLVDRLDGLVVSGGQDVHPVTLDIDGPPTDPGSDPRRDRHEIELITCAIERGTPLLGVCRGLQILNVALGGTLVPDLLAGEIDHRSPGREVADETHDVRFLTGSVMSGIYGERTRVNSLHHQAVDRLGSGLTVTGRAPDGVVEAVELGGAPVVGVQWHPEWRTHDPIFSWLVRAASTPKEEHDGTA